MKFRSYFRYSATVKWLSAFVFMCLLFVIWLLPPMDSWFAYLLLSLESLILLGALAIAPVYFEEDDHAYWLRHLCFKRRFDKANYSLEPCDDSCLQSVRIFGSGGLMGYTGFFWSKRLGRFEMYLSDTKDPLFRLIQHGHDKGGVVVNIRNRA